MASKTEGKVIRVLIAKPGLDGHDQGAKVIAYGLKDEGFEVIYTGLRRTPEEIVNAAVDEDVDVIGLSILSGAHLSIARRVMSLLREKGVEDKMVLVGGIIPPEDIPKLKEMGVAEVFVSGTYISQVAEFIRSRLGVSS
ncbi:cobalamin B12-binding domain-containing protein [Candidatus Solincola sp.]|jgi:methylmalonyl-CoA mutase C-terminal domain/subunit|nr:cobalamin B12-binding domain-containing protein [Actinomycetota bacterium]MDI7252429.1 cobalamin B12-binding domain-containing protein [Actinomycetota bacterium]